MTEPTRMTRRKRVSEKRTQEILLVVATMCLICGLCLAIWPTLEREAALEQQQLLMTAIAQGDGEIILHGAVTGEVDYYEEDAAEPLPSTSPSVPDTMPIEASAEKPTESPTEQITVVNGIGILKIAAIDLALPVVEGVRAGDLKIALGHVPDTAAIGEKGNAVVAGHRSYTYGDFLNRLDEVEIGDGIVYEGAEGETVSFEVYEIFTVDPGDPAVFDDTAFPFITLLTCTPVRVASHRLIVRGKLVGP